MKNKIEIDIHVVGLKHYTRLEVLDELTPFPIALKRQPDNEYDANAIEILPILEDHKLNGKCIGHIPATVASSLAPMMDSGQIKKITAIFEYVDWHSFSGQAKVTIYKKKETK